MSIIIIAIKIIVVLLPIIFIFILFWGMAKGLDDKYNGIEFKTPEEWEKESDKSDSDVDGK